MAVFLGVQTDFKAVGMNDMILRMNGHVRSCLYRSHSVERPDPTYEPIHAYTKVIHFYRNKLVCVNGKCEHSRLQVKTWILILIFGHPGRFRGVDIHGYECHFT